RWLSVARVIISQRALAARQRSALAPPPAIITWLATAAHDRMGSVRSVAVWYSAYNIKDDRLGNCISVKSSTT
ncbi:MAG: hypothetical protein ACHQK9_13225, partial [Reyranellales bacterium]